MGSYHKTIEFGARNEGEAKDVFTFKVPADRWLRKEDEIKALEAFQQIFTAQRSHLGGFFTDTLIDALSGAIHSDASADLMTDLIEARARIKTLEAEAARERAVLSEKLDKVTRERTAAWQTVDDCDRRIGELESRVAAEANDAVDLRFKIDRIEDAAVDAWKKRSAVAPEAIRDILAS